MTKEYKLTFSYFLKYQNIMELTDQKQINSR